jgi:hypothetical protein
MAGNPLHLILLVLSFVLFLLAAFLPLTTANVRINLMALGLASWVLAVLLGATK